VVWKTTATPAYQLAVVVDDAASGVTEVVRGDDLISLDGRGNCCCMGALGLNARQLSRMFPLVVGQDGRRLAKRHGDTRLATLRERGMTAAELRGMLAWSVRMVGAAARN